MARILHLVNSLARGGIEMWLLTMLRAVPRSECVMDVCCKGAEVGELAEAAEQLGASVHHVPMRADQVSFVRGLHRLLTVGKYDLLHNHVELYSGLPVWTARRAGVPVITSFHNTHFAPQTGWLRRTPFRQLRWLYGQASVGYALRQSNLVTGCSQGVLRVLDPGNRLLGNRSRVLYYGVETPPPATAEHRSDFRRSLGWNAEDPVLLHVGRLIEQKNHLGLLAVFRRVVERIPTASLVLVGDGILRPVIEAEIARHGLESRVRLLGLRDDVPALMSMADVFLFPSHHEGIGLVAIEAAAAGLPVVGSRVAGLEEAVQDGRSGTLHDVTDQEGMAASVVRILSDRPWAEQLITGSRAWVAEQFTVEASARRLLELYRDAAPAARGEGVEKSCASL